MDGVNVVEHGLVRGKKRSLDNPQRNILNGELLSKFLQLGTMEKLKVTKKIGTTPAQTCSREVHLEVDNSIKPVTTSTQRVPTALKDDLREELNRSVEKQILAPVEEPTPWVNSLAVTNKKSGAPRVCIDLRPLNKVLVYDRYGQDIISPLLNVKEFREMGITLHLEVHLEVDNSIKPVTTSTQRVPTALKDDLREELNRSVEKQVLALVEEPTPWVNSLAVTNKKSGAPRDCRNQLFESYYLNFISAISRHRLEDLVTAALQSNSVTQITKMFDQYLNFISLEDEMFTVRNQDRDSISYYGKNILVESLPEVVSKNLQPVYRKVVERKGQYTFSFFISSGTVPIIRRTKGNAAEMVVEGLDEKLRENLRDSRNSLFTTDIPSGQFRFVKMCTASMGIEEGNDELMDEFMADSTA
ncbi:Sec1 family domain-containing protein 1 [Stylophora pistillata]|uniref:Sec1 family domain-containing protein 1 n=1 Tax=Stylophora pistillata TaxID=50429 RepID=A0A2B4RIG2_STYPI|nr:Sec1 family domain-containing protein 1 [Stylophora pistillata]